MITAALNELTQKRDLSFDMARNIMNHIMDGSATEAQMAALLVALSCKGESIGEISACAGVMREHCNGLKHDYDVLEIVGTGGDKAFTFNISTVSAICLAAAGVKVAKHGNTSVSSKCGASDVLKELGVNINVSREKSQSMLESIGICFLFAPLYHTGMKYVAPVRKQLGIRTIFNILGPLANPASANLQLLGVYDERLIEPMANVLKNLGVKRAMVVRGSDGLDEITLTGKTKCCELCQDGSLKSYEIDPRDYGLQLCESKDLVGGDPKENAQIAIDILSGERSAKRDVVIINSAVGLYLASENKTLDECVEKITSVIDSSEGLKKLHEFIEVSNCD